MQLLVPSHGDYCLNWKLPSVSMMLQLSRDTSKSHKRVSLFIYCRNTLEDPLLIKFDYSKVGATIVLISKRLNKELD